MEQLGKILIFAGIILIIAGLIIYFAGNKLSWLGHLPGDIRIVKENVKIFIPITTMILISVVLSLLLFLIKKLFS
jgi:cytochrome b subunit of formate dehydrogenase